MKSSMKIKMLQFCSAYNTQISWNQLSKI